jgi:hypothetical protein
MRLTLLQELHCPYCGSAFELSRNVSSNRERLEYGLIRCSCFEFPVVEGILLLSLAKGYGGAEEDMQPYVPLQAAAVAYLGRGDVQGLKAWIKRHSPLAAALAEGSLKTYLQFVVAYELTLRPVVSLFLARAAHYEVVGDIPARAQLARRLGSSGQSSRLLDALQPLAARFYNWRLHLSERTASEAFEREQLRKYYVQRFFCPRANATSLHLRHLPKTGRILSLCSGHGVFENWLQIAGIEPAQLVCVDAQIINLLVVRHLIGANADLICHDVQFDLPFADGSFDGVFSSTCLPEIPPQSHFIRQAVRVTASHGWTAFDSIWTVDSGVERISPKRHYRFCQNFLQRLRDYPPLFQRSAGQRRVGFDVSGAPREYLSGPRWTFDEAELARRLDEPRDTDINALIISDEHFTGFEREPSLDWVSADRICLSPAYSAERHEESVVVERNPEFAQFGTRFASRDFGDLEERLSLDGLGPPSSDTPLDLYCRGVAAPLPARFGGQRRLLSDVFGTARGPRVNRQSRS